MSVLTKTTNAETGKIDLSTQFYKTSLCTDLYTDETDTHLIDQFMPFKSMTESFTYDWYCPDISEI